MGDLMDTEEYLNEDEIFPWFDFAINLPRYTVMSAIFNCGFIISIVFFVWQSYLLLIHFNAKYFTEYSPVYFASVFVMISLGIYIQSYKVFSPHVKRFKQTVYWNMNMASNKTQELIWRDRMRIRCVYLIQLLVGLLSSSLNGYVCSSDYEHYFAFSSIIINYFPEYYNYIHYLVVLMVVFTFFPMIAGFWYTFYLLIYFKIQIYMLIDKLSFVNLDNIYSCDEHLSKDCNEKVKKLLVFCLKRHVRIIEYLSFVSEKAQTVITLFIFGSFFFIIFTVCTIFVFITGMGIAIVCTLCYFMSLAIISYELQLFHDSVYDLSETFYNLNWYMWNSENEKIYKIIHLYISQRNLTLPIPTIFNSNLMALRSVGKYWYTCANCIYSIGKNRPK
ncbi:uncharacterized protein [Euwallacea fornicatus]|uniref:uncharacterized protein isoform X2 n=1 Tax=Euwallacea fornicatus TaxID=995702 RepID=UPI00338E0BD6